MELKLNIKVVILFLLSFLFPIYVFSATIYVNSSTGNDSTGTGTSGSPYLTFNKAYTMSSSGDTINLTGTFDWSNASETGDSSTSGYTLSKNLTITGQTADATIIQASSTAYTANRRIFTVSSSATVTIQNLTLRYGYMAVDNESSAVTMSSGSTLTMLNTVVTQNANNGRFGSGAIKILGSGKFIMRNSTVYSNNGITAQGVTSASWYGYTGGIEMYSTNTGNEITNSTFYDNGAQYNGAIYTSGTGVKLTVTNSTFIGNRGITSGTDIHSYGSAVVYLKNNIFAQKASGSVSSLVAASGGSFTDGGNNIIETQSSAGFTNGVNGNLVGTQSSLNISSSLNLNNATTGVLTLSLSSGSVAIDSGTTTAHNSISVPSTDARNFNRDATPDIGAYEYGAVASDTTAPTVSVTAPTSLETVGGSSVSLSATASDDVSVSGVKFYIDSILQGSEDTSSPYSISWNSTATSSDSHTIFAVARDSSNNYATSSSISFTVDNTEPVISSIASSTTSTTADITWTTDEQSSSLVRFGVVSGFGTTTAEADTATRITNHSITLSGLKSCVRYYFQVQSTDTYGNIASSSTNTFKTTGCTGNASILSTGQNTIDVSTGGNVTEGNITLTIPTSFTSATTSAIFQVQKIDSTNFFTSAGVPSGKVRIGNDVFSLFALSDATTSISSFSSSITVSLSYSDSDVSGYSESSLVIKRYDGSSWNSLSSCSVNTSLNTVTCTTTSFSDFAIFGDENVTNNASSTSGDGIILGFIGSYKSLSNIATQFSTTTEKIESDSKEKITKKEELNLNKEKLFLKNLKANMKDEDVYRLQKFLNQKGFVLTKKGVGSPENETDFFGPMTYNALVKFQEAYIEQILKPVGLKKGSGVMGELTRKFINSVLDN